MSKYLFSPAFDFTTKFLAGLNDNSSVEDKRVLVYPIANGVRLRTMDMYMYATLEVSGQMVKLDFEESVEVDEMRVPYTATANYTVHDVSAIVKKVDGFFNKEWSIEKDV